MDGLPNCRTWAKRGHQPPVDDCVAHSPSPAHVGLETPGQALRGRVACQGLLQISAEIRSARFPVRSRISALDHRSSGKPGPYPTAGGDTGRYSIK